MQRLLLTEQKGLPASKALNFFFFPYKTSPCQDLGACLCVKCARLCFYLCKQREILSLGGWDRHWDGQGVTGALPPSLQHLLHLHP